MKVRAKYTLLLFVFSLTTLLLVPVLYMLFTYLLLYTPVEASRKFEFNLFYQWLHMFITLNVFIIFVLTSFLLLTSLLVTLRSINTFRYVNWVKRQNRDPFLEARESQKIRSSTPYHRHGQRMPPPRYTTTKLVRKPGFGVIGAPPGLFVASELGGQVYTNPANTRLHPATARIRRMQQQRGYYTPSQTSMISFPSTPGGSGRTSVNSSRTRSGKVGIF